MDEDVLPRDEHVAQDDEAVRLVEARRERAVEPASSRSVAYGSRAYSRSPGVATGTTIEIA